MSNASFAIVIKRDWLLAVLYYVCVDKKISHLTRLLQRPGFHRREKKAGFAA
jgi:hypothetical protein